ncbi:hypothetical protein [Anaerotruncus colihominis]|uniref:hypothetical protein n=1 Tax=Anaerotruncus colihominis TaxID=169435 RepID=UPI0026F12796|nr:hypothetical protein [Anaerotruncus colihominis]
MNNRIDARLAAIAAELERRRMIQSEPIDPLSASLFAFEKELAGLDEQSRDALFLQQDILNREQFEHFILDYMKGR